MKINYRQLSIMTFMSFIAVKLFALPGWMYIESGNTSWLVTLVLMLIDGLYALVIISLMKKTGYENIYDFMRDTLGKVLTKVILIFLIFKYLIVIGILGRGLEFFVIENLYEEYDWYVYGLPLIAVVGFMIYKGIRNIGRVMEFFWIAIILSCLFIAFKSILSVNVLSFLPMFKDGAIPLVKSGYMHLSWFGSSTFLIMLFGQVDFNKGKRHNIIWYIIGAIGLVMLLYFVFYGLFDETSPSHQFCISDISQFNASKSTVGELSWLVTCLWIVVQLTQFAMYGYCLVKAIMYLFDIKFKFVGILFLSAYVCLWGYISATVIDAEWFFLTGWSSMATIIAEYVVPWVLYCGYLLREKKRAKVRLNNEKIKNNI